MFLLYFFDNSEVDFVVFSFLHYFYRPSKVKIHLYYSSPFPFSRHRSRRIYSPLFYFLLTLPHWVLMCSFLFHNHFLYYNGLVYGFLKLLSSWNTLFHLYRLFLRLRVDRSVKYYPDGFLNRNSLLFLDQLSKYFLFDCSVPYYHLIR